MRSANVLEKSFWYRSGCPHFIPVSYFFLPFPLPCFFSFCFLWIWLFQLDVVVGAAHHFPTVPVPDALADAHR